MATRRFGNSAFRVNAVVYALGAPLRNIRPIKRQRRFVLESLDLSNIEITTIGSPVYEIEADVRYDDVPQTLLDYIFSAANGLQIDYIPNVDVMATYYPCILLLADDALALEPDRDTWWDSEYELTLRLRRNDGGTFSGIL